MRASAAALIAAFLISASAGACPEGEHEICVMGCICVPDSLKPYEDLGMQMAVPALEQWLQASRDTAAQDGTHLIPPIIRSYLSQYYPARILNLARYKVGDATELSAAHAMMQNERVKAVTLIDVVVFRFADDAQESASMWAHELHHIEQFDRWGVRDFALRYVRNAQAVETPAYEMQEKIAARLRAEPQGGLR